MPARAVTNIPSVFMLMPSFCREKIDWTRATSRSSPSSARARSAPKALTVSTPETSSTRWAESWAASSIACAGAPPRGRVVRRHAGHQHRDEGRRHQRQPDVVEPEHRQQDDHQRAVDHRGQRRAADGLAHLGGVVDPREDLADLPHLEEPQGQPQDVAGVAGDQRQVDLAADVGQQVLAEQAEEGPEQDDQHHADAQGVEQPPLVADQHGVDQVLDEVRGGDPQHGHQQGADEGLDQDRGVGAQQAQEPPPRADRRAAAAARQAARCPGTTSSR